MLGEGSYRSRLHPGRAQACAHMLEQGTSSHSLAPYYESDSLVRKADHIGAT